MRWSSLWNWKRLWIGFGVLAVCVGLMWWLSSRTPHAPALKTAPVQRGEVVSTVTATGTIEPEEVVDVGAQVVGIIQEFGRDPRNSSRLVDFGTAVEEGTVLARIDDSLYRARLDKASALVEQWKAQVAQAEADLLRAEANAKQSVAKYNQTSRDWVRAQVSYATGTLSEQEHDAALSAYEVAKADIAVTEAAIRQARAALNAAEKSLGGAQADQREAQKDLDYTVIRSPVRFTTVDQILAKAESPAGHACRYTHSASKIAVSARTSSLHAGFPARRDARERHGGR